MLPPATTHLEATAAGLVVPIQTLAGQGETGDEE